MKPRIEAKGVKSGSNFLSMLGLVEGQIRALKVALEHGSYRFPWPLVLTHERIRAFVSGLS